MNVPQCNGIYHSILAYVPCRKCRCYPRFGASGRGCCPRLADHAIRVNNCIQCRTRPSSCRPSLPSCGGSSSHRHLHVLGSRYCLRILNPATSRYHGCRCRNECLRHFAPHACDAHQPSRRREGSQGEDPGLRKSPWPTWPEPCRLHIPEAVKGGCCGAGCAIWAAESRECGWLLLFPVFGTGGREGGQHFSCGYALSLGPALHSVLLHDDVLLVSLLLSVYSYIRCVVAIGFLWKAKETGRWVGAMH